MPLQQFIRGLQKALESPLPGRNAHMMMSPQVREHHQRMTRDNVEPRLGSVLILFYEYQGEIMLPLIQRPQYNGVHSGQVSLPGGKLEPGETLIETALRETREEIGVSPDQLQVVGLLSQFYVWVSNFKVQPVVAYTNTIPSFTPDMHEVMEVVEVSLQQLIKKDIVKSKKMPTAQGISVRAPYFDVNGKEVWGATAMMLSEMLEIIRKMGYYQDKM